MATATIEIPKSLQIEHQAIHSALAAATKVTGVIGAAARELAEILHPHFEREEQIALPPLGLLAALATNAPLSFTTQSEAMHLTDALKSELPRMLEEHHRIRAAVEKLREAARAEASPEHEKLADDLALHARTEEEVLYPAAVLVGDLIRARLRNE
jgi:hypothetical protein